jgi:hypothetical protein
MDVARAGQIALLMLSPTLVVEAALYLPRGVWLVRRLLTARHVDKRLQPMRRLLYTLAEARLVLPPAVCLSAPDGRQ